MKEIKSEHVYSRINSKATTFFFNATATTEIYTLSLHDALPILLATRSRLDFIINNACQTVRRPPAFYEHMMEGEDRKSTRLNSSHSQISYAVFCLKKKKNDRYTT